MNRTPTSIIALALVLWPGGGFAATCQDALVQLKNQIGMGTLPALVDAVSQIKAAGCNRPTESAALAQASAAMAGIAQRQMGAGDLPQAEQTLAQAPTLHWAIQAVRGDLAAKRGDRAQAAQMYGTALDTITDPTLTPPDARLVPVAKRISQLAQENMMLSGSMSSSVTRGGQASGVLKSAMRGIQIEKAGTAPKADPAVAPKADIYANAPKETYAVADAVAGSVETVYLPIRFAFGSDQIDGDGRREAETLASFLRSNNVYRLTVVGHTDEIGSEASNLDLSLRRAQTVKRFLEQKGVQAYIAVAGKGESEPPVLVDYTIYSDEERRKIARRVELVLHE